MQTFFNSISVLTLFYGGLIEYNTKRVTMLIYWFRDIRRILHCLSLTLSFSFPFFTTFICIITNDSLATQTKENNNTWKQVFSVRWRFHFFLEWNGKFPIEAWNFVWFVVWFSEVDFGVLWLCSRTPSICPSFVPNLFYAPKPPRVSLWKSELLLLQLHLAGRACVAASRSKDRAKDWKMQTKQTKLPLSTKMETFSRRYRCYKHCMRPPIHVQLGR